MHRKLCLSGLKNTIHGVEVNPLFKLQSLKNRPLKTVVFMSLLTTLVVSGGVRGNTLNSSISNGLLLSEINSIEINNTEVKNIHDSWNDLLSRHVTTVNGGYNTKVDYVGINAQRAKLQAYLKTLTAIKQNEFDDWNYPKQLAFLINAYNAWTVEFILINQPSDELQELKSIKDLGSMFSSPWSKSFIPLLGETRSLDGIEHGLIRSGLDENGKLRYQEPRIHFAVNCASIGCPALREEAYTGDKLESQLEQQAVRFLSDKTRNIAKNNTLELSSIFKWYREDFEQGYREADSLEAFLALYSDSLKLTPTQLNSLKKEDMKVKFLKYDWNLNGQP